MISKIQVRPSQDLKPGRHSWSQIDKCDSLRSQSKLVGMQLLSPITISITESGCLSLTLASPERGHFCYTSSVTSIIKVPSEILARAKHTDYLLFQSLTCFDDTLVSQGCGISWALLHIMQGPANVNMERLIVDVFLPCLHHWRVL